VRRSIPGESFRSTGRLAFPASERSAGAAIAGSVIASQPAPACRLQKRPRATAPVRLQECTAAVLRVPRSPGTPRGEASLSVGPAPRLGMPLIGDRALGAPGICGTAPRRPRHARTGRARAFRAARGRPRPKPAAGGGAKIPGTGERRREVPGRSRRSAADSRGGPRGLLRSDPSIGRGAGIGTVSTRSAYDR